jgi:hypothetical protein
LLHTDKPSYDVAFFFEAIPSLKDANDCYNAHLNATNPNAPNTSGSSPGLPECSVDLSQIHLANRSVTGQATLINAMRQVVKQQPQS